MTPQPFIDPAWMAPWFAAFEPHAETITIGPDDAPYAKLCKGNRTLHKVNLRALISPANCHTPRYGWSLDGVNAGELQKRLEESRKRYSWDVIDLNLVGEGSATHLAMQMLQDAGEAVEIRPIQHTSVIDLTRGEKAYFEGISKKLRSNTNLAENGLKRQGNLEMREVSCGGDWQDWLEKMFELEAAGWKGEKGTAISQTPYELEFYRKVFGAAQREDRFRLYVLLLDGNLIAGNVLVLVDGVYYGFKMAFDERYAKQSPGNVLQRFVLRALFSEGRAQKLDMLDPVTPWKERWQTGTEALLRIYIYAPTLRGQCVYRARKTARWALRQLRTLRERKKSKTLTPS